MKKIIMTFSGLLLVLYMTVFAFFNNFNIGVFIPFAAGVIIAVWCYLPDNKIIKWGKRIFAAGGTLFVVFMVLIGIMAQTNSAQFNEDAVIVLGCGLHGDKPSLNLADRLDNAVEYNNKNPRALIVVSGGQGPQEDITEAEAMYRYLVERNVPSESIIMEDKATSTNENYRFSKAILDERLGSDYTVVYITNSFHSYRAGELAKLNGLDARSYNAVTRLPSLLPNYAREVLAVIQMFVFRK